jgi:hypothetical protein
LLISEFGIAVPPTLTVIGSVAVGGFDVLCAAMSWPRSRRPTLSDLCTRAAQLLCVAGVLATPAFAQELVPAAYAPAPKGGNLLSLSGGYSSGDLSFDPSLPISDASARIHSWNLSYGRTFAFFGRAASVTAFAPYVVGDLEGIYLGEQAYAERSGFADATVRVGVNFFGAPAMDVAEYRTYRPRTLLGTSLTVSAPTGEYDPSKLINIGTNRWGFKPEIGVVQVVGNWAFDFYVGGWFYTTNSDFYGGNTRQQDPIFSTQAHVRYFVNRDLWAAIDGNFWRGGQTSVNGVMNDDLQSNSRVGFTVAWTVRRGHGLRIAASRGAFTRIGGDFSSIGVAYNYTWMKKKAAK